MQAPRNKNDSVVKSEGFKVYFEKLTGETLELADLTPSSTIGDLRETLRKRFPSEPSSDLTWIFYAGMPIMGPESASLDNYLDRRRSSTLKQYRPDANTMSILQQERTGDGLAQIHGT